MNFNANINCRLKSKCWDKLVAQKVTQKVIKKNRIKMTVLSLIIGITGIGIGSYQRYTQPKYTIAIDTQVEDTFAQVFNDYSLDPTITLDTYAN